MSVEEFLLPDLGEGLTESEIVRWHVAEGDRVALDQVIAEVETAKAVVEMPSPYAGVVQRLHAPEGTVVDVGAPIITFRLDDADDVDGADHPADGPTGSGDAAADQPSGGDAAETADDEDEAPPPNLVGYGAAAAAKGTPTRRARRFAPVVLAAEVAQVAPAPDAPAVGLRTAPPVRSSPPVRALARRLGVLLDDLVGTGEHGLVTRADVEGAVGTDDAGSTAPVVPSGASVPPAGPADRADAPGDERIPVRGVRKLTAEAMVASATTAPHITLFLTVDVTATAELVARLRAARDAQVRPSFLAAVARALCLAVAHHPEVNSRWAGTEIVRRRAVDLGIAAATPRGLVVPVLRDVGGSGLLELAAGIADLATTARAGRTTPAAMTGGSITISNVGVFGVDAGTPILHDGQAAILAVGTVAARPWEHAGTIALRQLVTLSLSVDHRVLDGEQGARFLAEIGATLSDPARAFVG